MKPTDLADCTATGLLALYRTGQTSPVEATQAALARIARHNPRLRAFVHVAAEEALASAQASSSVAVQSARSVGFIGTPGLRGCLRHHEAKTALEDAMTLV